MTGRNRDRLADADRVAKESYWPILLALAVAIAVGGLVVHPVVSILGLAACVFGVVSWGLERSHAYRGPMVASGRSVTYAAGVDEQRDDRSPRRWGLAWFILSEAAFFANLIAAYIYLRARGGWFTAELADRELIFPAFNTVILLGSTIPAYHAHRSADRGDRRGTLVGLGLAALLGIIFLVGQGYEYLNAGVGLRSGVLAAGFFVLTGFHGAHVLAGIGLLLGVLVAGLRGRLIDRDSFAVEFASTYWHFVDVVWIFLFVVLYVL